MRVLDPAKHDQKRRDIIAAAGRCFARSGFQGATTADICAEAKISSGHLYHYFASKDEILSALAETSLAHATELFREMAQSPDPIGRLLMGLRGIMNERRADQNLLLEVLAEAGRNRVIGKLMREHSRTLRGLLKDVLRSGQVRGEVDPELDTDVAAAILLSVGDGVKSLGVRDPRLDLKKAFALLERMILRFLSDRPLRG